MIVVARKWLAGDARWADVSEADRAALEVGLQLAAAAGDAVTVVTVGPPGAERVLREALAVGASHAVRVDAPPDLCSVAVGAALGAVASGARWVVCGDASADRGSGSVPAFVAAELRCSQALGLVSVGPADHGSTAHAVRRLDGGRREILELRPPTVLSVEGAVARLRRAALGAEVAARAAPIEVRPGPAGLVDDPAAVVPYRPRPRAMAMPHGDALDRVRVLTALGGAPTGHGETITLDAAAAAARIVDALTTWGYLPGR